MNGFALRALAATAVFITAVSPAIAQTCTAPCTTPVVHDGGSAALRIKVTASVGGRCGFATAPNATLAYPNFDQVSDTKSASFVLDCTGPSRVAVTSANGGLQNSAASLPSGYSNLASYTVNLRLTPTVGSPVTLSQGCPSEVLRQAAPVSGTTECNALRGSATFNGVVGLRLPTSSTGKTSFLDVRVGPDTIASGGNSPVMVNGNYADTLSVTVAASL